MLSELQKNHIGLREFHESAHVAEQEDAPAECSKSSDFSPAQPRRAKTRRSAGKAAASEGPRRTRWGTLRV